VKPEEFMEEYIVSDRFRDLCDLKIETDITQDILLNLSEGGNMKIFCKTDYVLDLMTLLGSFKRNKYIVISMNSDKPIDENRFSFKPKNVVKWFAQNVDYEHPDLIPIPIGVERPSGGGISSDMTVLRDCLIEKPDVTFNGVYMNFNIKNNTAERESLHERLKSKRWVILDEKVPFKTYLHNASLSKYVLSPPGNGIDCHRTWEALYLGAVPIVKESILIKSFRQGVPMVTLKNLDLLDDKMFDVLSKAYGSGSHFIDSPMLKMSYWKKRIEEVEL